MEHKRASRRAIHSVAKYLNVFFHSSKLTHNSEPEKTHNWFSVLCLTGVDYFSTLAYQPGIALLAIGVLAPFSSLVLIFVTLFGAVPTYIQVAKRSFTGQGSIAILEGLINGWKGKLIVLALIAFAVTDFFITMTLSASDAAAHIVENPYLHTFLTQNNVFVSLILILFLGYVFFMGLREAIVLSIFITLPFLCLTSIVVIKCLLEIIQTPNVMHLWLGNPVFQLDYTSLFFITVFAFPKLALGLSGFETGVSVMPLIENTPEKNSSNPMQGRIKGTSKLLIVSALIMSVYLILSSFATSVLLHRSQVVDGGEAAGRALSFLAHQYLGNLFGTIYDVSTIVILWFAGASAMAGLLAIIPRYLPRFGMAPPWIESRKPLVILITAINVIIIFIFHANVNAQSGAYATGVLALILSATIAVTLSFYNERKKAAIFDFKVIYFFLVSLVFAYTLFMNIGERPDGIIIATIFFILIFIASFISRWRRAFELRVKSAKFVDAQSEIIFNSIKNKKVDLVPTSSMEEKWFTKKQRKIEQHYNISSSLAFLIIHLRDDRSEFMSPLEIKVTQLESDSKHYLIEAFGAVAIPNTIAYVSEQLCPISIYLGLARKNAMEQSFSYLFFGEGEVGIITYKVLVQRWEELKEDVRPMIFLMSE